MAPRETPAAPAPRSYVRRGGLDVLPAPWRCEDVEMHAFYVAGELAALQRLCDRCLNEPSRGHLHYQPDSHYVIVTFQNLRGLHSIAPGCEDRGTHTYTEAAFWVMTSARDASGTRVGGPTLMIPYIFASDGLAVATGREVYGYPKEHAVVRMPGDGGGDGDYVVEALAVPCYAPGAPAVAGSEIMRCRRTNSSALAGLGHTAMELGEDLLSVVRQGGIDGSALALMRDFISMMLHKKLGLVFLRQFRATAATSGYDLQSVVGSSLEPLVINSMCLLKGRYELILPPLDSHPIAADMGFITIDGKIDIMMGVRMKLAFDMCAGQTLWPAPAS